MNYTFHLVASAVGSARFGMGQGPIWLDDVRCVKDESSLLFCDHSGVGRHSCRHSEDVGVICVFGKCSVKYMHVCFMSINHCITHCIIANIICVPLLAIATLIRYSTTSIHNYIS